MVHFMDIFSCIESDYTKLKEMKGRLNSGYTSFWS